MTLFQKRTLIMFSVALNIGFVVMAVIMAFHHSGRSHKFSEVMDIVKQLNLPEPQENKALECIRQFKTVIRKQDQDVKQARDNIIRLAANPVPLDKNRLHQLHEAAIQEEREKYKLFEAHVIEMRNLLGNEKGAQFYTQLLKHLQKKNASHH